MEAIHLIVVGGSETGKGVRLERGASITIGRGSENQLVLHDPRVSRCHARIDAVGGRLRVFDLESRNGVQVNGISIKEGAIAPGDTIRIGDQMIQLAAGRASEAPPLAGDFGLTEAARQVEVTARAAPRLQAAELIGQSMGEYRIEAAAGGDADWLGFAARTAGGTPVHLRALRVPILAPEHEASFLQRISESRALSHPNVLAVLDAGIGEGLGFVVHEAIEATDLDARLQAGDEFALDRLLDWVDEAGLALAHAHGAGVHHLGVRPSNCLVESAGGRLRLVGFGGSRALEAMGLPPISPGVDPSTLAFRAPEQLMDPSGAGEPADVYGLGTVLYSLLSGAPPFREATNRMHVMNCVLGEEPADPLDRRPEAPRALGEVVRTALAKDPEARFPSIEAFRLALEGARG